MNLKKNKPSDAFVRLDETHNSGNMESQVEKSTQCGGNGKLDDGRSVVEMVSEFFYSFL